MSCNCCICHRPVADESAGILTMGGYATPKYLCEECEGAISVAAESEDSSEIRQAIEKLGTSLTKADTGDVRVINIVTEMIDDAGKRAEAIDNGTYVKEESDTTEEAEEFDITEELQETEEDKKLDEHEAAVNKKLDTVFSWVSAGLLALVVIFFIIRFIF